MTPLMIAELVAQKAHDGQFRRDGKTPYINHIKDVVSRVESEDEKIVAWLHDTVEDTEVTFDDLAGLGLSPIVLEAIIAMTKPDGGVSYIEYLKGVKASPLATRVKLADIASNMSDKPTDHQIQKYTKALEFLQG